MSRARPFYSVRLDFNLRELITGDEMPVNSRDVQFGAAIGFIVIVGIVAIYFGFSTKLVLALLAGLGILFCASLVEGYVRAAMLGTGALLLLLIAYDLATSCDRACQQTRVEAARQRAAQEQARITPASAPANTSEECPGRLSNVITLGVNEFVYNPKGCWSYTMGQGVIVLKGIGGLEATTDLAVPSPHIPWKSFSVRAKDGTASFQYILCAGPKQHMERLDCS
jgi:hypothetical protein